MILMTLNPSLQVIAKESVSDDLTVYTDAGESLELYARSAVLMDGDSGRILFEKNGSDPRPMASTTKIMTCILPSKHLIYLEDHCQFSSSLPAKSPSWNDRRTVFLFKRSSLFHMLESHNDAAVAIAGGN